MTARDEMSDVEGETALPVAGRVVSRCYCDSAFGILTIADALTNTTTLTYTGGALATITNPTGKTTTRFTDGGGRLRATTNPLGQQVPPVFATNYVQTSIPLAGSLVRGAGATNYVVNDVYLLPDEFTACTVLARRKQCDPS